MHALDQTPCRQVNFNQFYQSHELLVRAIVRQFKFKDAAADDLVQDIFIKAWRGLEHLDNHAALTGWLKVIARNECINEIKIQKKHRHLVSVECVIEEVNATPSHAIFEITFFQLEEHFLVLTDLIQNHKDPIRRQIACLFYMEQWTIKDICQHLQMKQNTVLSHLRRFRLIVTKAMHRWMAEHSSQLI